MNEKEINDPVYPNSQLKYRRCSWTVAACPVHHANSVTPQNRCRGQSGVAPDGRINRRHRVVWLRPGNGGYARLLIGVPAVRDGRKP